MNHRVRAVIGNGMRPDVWRVLLDRHGNGIHVYELYAATEGNIGFINYFNKFGCVGTLSPLYQVFVFDHLFWKLLSIFQIWYKLLL